MSDLPNLFGEPNAEQMRNSAESVLERYDADLHEVVVEEWTASPVSHVLPSNIEDIVESIAEHYGDCELDEDGYEAFLDAGRDATVLAAMQNVVNAWHGATTTGYRMADRHIANHHYMWIDEAWALQVTENLT